jgi:uncharacterized membrane protein YkvA (DUF1232 family)
MVMPSTARNAQPDLTGQQIQTPAAIAANERQVKSGFWRKVARFAGRLPFAEDVVAAYYCALDSGTPLRVRAILLAALAYFIMPADIVPDFILGFGFTDDATVIATAIGMAYRHITEDHRIAARRVLQTAGDRPA